MKYSRHSRIKFTVFRARAKPFGVKITTEASLTGTGHIHVRFWHKADIGIRALAGWMCRHFRARLARVRHTSAVNPRSVPCGDWMWLPDNPPTLLNAAESKAHCAKVTSNFGGSPQLLNPVMTQSLAMVQATVNLSTNVARQELASYIQGNEARAHIDGPQLLVEPNTAQTVAMTLHELATNAAKYGALSVVEGRVEVKWSLAANNRLILTWTEKGGPAAKKPTRQGFGTRVMKAMIDQQKGGLRLDWRAEGLACEIILPV